MVEYVWNLMAHGDAREGKWRGNWRMEWVVSILTLSRNVVYPALLTLMRTSRLPAVDWTDDPANLNGLVRFDERRNLVSARVPSRFKRSLQQLPCDATVFINFVHRWHLKHNWPTPQSAFFAKFFVMDWNICVNINKVLTL